MAEDQEASQSITVEGETYFLNSEGYTKHIPLWQGKRKRYRKRDGQTLTAFEEYVQGDVAKLQVSPRASHALALRWRATTAIICAHLRLCAPQRERNEAQAQQASTPTQSNLALRERRPRSQQRE